MHGLGNAPNVACRSIGGWAVVVAAEKPSGSKDFTPSLDVGLHRLIIVGRVNEDHIRLEVRGPFFSCCLGILSDGLNMQAGDMVVEVISEGGIGIPSFGGKQASLFGRPFPGIDGKDLSEGVVGDGSCRSSMKTTYFHDEFFILGVARQPQKFIMRHPAENLLGL